MQARAAFWRFFTGAGAEPTRESVVLRRLFWTGFLVRLAYITLAHTYRFRTENDHFPYGWEMGRIARSLAMGQGFANPFDGRTGPTAWTPPLYPLLMALYFKLFGVYSNLSAWFLLATNSVFSAATAPLIYRIGRRCFSESSRENGVALWGGWLWALYPAALQYAVHWPWEMALTTALFTYVLLAGLVLRGVGGSHTVSSAQWTGPWALWGLAWGLIALSNSSLLSFLPVQLAWILWPFRYNLRPVLGPALAGVLIIAAAMAPWTLRNLHAFHAFVPLRGNLGIELYNSVLPSHEGFPWGTVFPAGAHSPQLQRYAALGELAYSRELAAQARTLIAADPSRSLGYVLLRVQFFWASVPHPYSDHGVLNEWLRELNYNALSVSGLLGMLLALHRRIPAAGLFAAALAVVPLIYYAITVQARFRHPLEPILVLFSVFLFRSADRSRLFSRAARQPAPAEAWQ